MTKLLQALCLAAITTCLPLSIAAVGWLGGDRDLQHAGLCFAGFVALVMVPVAYGSVHSEQQA